MDSRKFHENSESIWVYVGEQREKRLEEAWLGFNSSKAINKVTGSFSPGKLKGNVWVNP